MLAVLSAVLLLAGSQPGTSASLKYDVPAGWLASTPSSSMRVAEFTLPRAAPDDEDAALVIYYFGGSGGSVQANLDRWISQMRQPDGRPSSDVATKTTFESHGLPITLLDLTGTYVAAVSPGASEHYDKPGFRLRAAVVETPNGPYFIKLTGPERTVARWDDAFAHFLESLRFE
jgi:hypothetical protein